MITPDFIQTLLLIPLISIMTYLIPICVFDILDREVEPLYWIPLLIINIPVMIYLYLTEWYPWYCFVISLVTIFIFSAMFKLELLQGADYLFLSFISMFWIVNPHNPWPHGVQIQFYIYLMIAMLITAAILPFANYLRGVTSDNLLEMMSTYPRGVPFMLPISAAFLLSYLFG